MALIDGKYITVENESPDFPITVTEQPVEKGINLIDHVQVQARVLPLTGFIVGPDAAKTRAYLNAAKDKGQIVSYVGRNAFKGLITAFSTGHDYTMADGFSFSMELREVRLATSSYVGTLPPPIKAQVATIVNSGTKQTKEQKTKSKTPKTDAAKKKAAAAAAKKKSQDKGKVEKVKFKSGSKWGTGLTE